MNEQIENSSLPILLVISGTVLLSVTLGWFLLDRDDATQVAPSEDSQPILQEASIVVPEDDGSAADIDANLRKARLAADADILAYPPDQSALHFYGRILAVKPDHVVANAELDTVLSRISRIASSHLASAEFGDAYELALLVTNVRPDHPIVHEVQQTLDGFAGELVAQAMEHAQNGDDDAAVTALKSAEALPGRQPDYFAAVRDSITEIKESRTAAENERIQRSRLAAAQATENWVSKVRGAIDTGQLITPPGESARDYLAERSTMDEHKEQLTKELVAALISTSRNNIEQGQLPVTETLLNAADKLSGDNAELTELRRSLEKAYIEAEESRIVSLKEVVTLSAGPARYPRRARERSITGWVEVLFTVTLSGETGDIEVSRSEPEDIFDEAAVEAVEKWTFEPRLFRGQLITQRVGVRLVFRLD